MPTEQLIWCREERVQIPGPGSTFPTVADANQHIADLNKRNDRKTQDSTRKTYDVIPVQVP